MFVVITFVILLDPGCFSAIPRTTKSRSVTSPTTCSFSTTGINPIDSSFIFTAASYTLSSVVHCTI
ncbi:Uncharacterised protein [Streptococcus pneumoniae]|nr:Uncharacterised protein [Streptococcus pneumoniae]